MSDLFEPVNRFNDALMKYVFAKEERKALTMSLINSFFERGGTPLIAEFEFSDREFSPDYEFGKTSRFDILGRSNDGTFVNTEVQADQIRDIEQRILYYWARLYHQLNSGDDYARLNRTVCITILAYTLFPVKIAPDAHNVFAVMNKRHPEHILTPDLELHFIELPKWERLRPSLERMTMLDKWMAYFSKKTTRKELEAIAMAEPMIDTALGAERVFMREPYMRTEYEMMEKARRDRVAREQFLRDEGREKWRNEGFKEGMAKLAKSLLETGTPIEYIKKATGWTEREILGL